MIIAFCGHADYIPRAEDEERVLDLLEKQAKNAPCEFFLGGYGSFDRFAHHCAKKFKQVHTNATITFVTPYLPAREEHTSFDLVVYPPLENVPPRFAISHRNRWIVQQADFLIAYVNRRYGGAYTMYQFALKNNKTVHNLAAQG